ncbi:MAG: recombinase family protein [Nitrososphaerota archaeon]|nr:recombinase family protein [Nitrososphaerota archaeon]
MTNEDAPETVAESPIPTATPLAYGYARVSTAAQKKEGNLRIQEDAIRRFCKDKELRLAAIFADAASGMTTEREGLTKLFKALGDEPGKKVVVVTKLDRFGRSLIDLYGNMERLKEHDADFVSLGDPGLDTTTPNGKLLFTIIAAIAEYERSLIRSRLNAGLERARLYGSKSGKPLHRPPRPIDERKLKRLYLEEGWGLRRLAREFHMSINGVKNRLVSLGIHKGTRAG